MLPFHWFNTEACKKLFLILFFEMSLPLPIPQATLKVLLLPLLAQNIKIQNTPIQFSIIGSEIQTNRLRGRRAPYTPHLTVPVSCISHFLAGVMRFLRKTCLLIVFFFGVAKWNRICHGENSEPSVRCPNSFSLFSRSFGSTRIRFPIEFINSVHSLIPQGF